MFCNRQARTATYSPGESYYSLIGSSSEINTRQSTEQTLGFWTAAQAVQPGSDQTKEELVGKLEAPLQCWYSRQEPEFPAFRVGEGIEYDVEQVVVAGVTAEYIEPDKKRDVAPAEPGLQTVRDDRLQVQGFGPSA